MRLIFTFFLYLSFLFSGLSQTPIVQWQKTYGGSANDEIRSTQQTTDGGYASCR